MNTFRDAMNAAYYAVAITMVMYAVRAELRAAYTARHTEIVAHRAMIETRASATADAMRSRLPFYRSIRDDLMREEGL